VRKEGRLWRWIACSIDANFHTTLLEENQRLWPEATVFFYLWTRAESWITWTMAKHVRDAGADHVSMHNDGIKFTRNVVHTAINAFRLRLEEHMHEQTQYKVSLTLKSQLFSIDILKAIASAPELDLMESEFLKPHNAIVAAIARSHSEAKPNLIVALKTKSHMNSEAEAFGARTYADVQMLTGVAMRPTLAKDIVRDRSYVMHCEPNGRPVAVFIQIDDRGNCTMAYGTQVRRFTMPGMMGALSKSLDSRNVVFFLIHDGVAPVIPEADSILLQLAASSYEEVPAVPAASRQRLV